MLRNSDLWSPQTKTTDSTPQSSVPSSFSRLTDTCMAYHNCVNDMANKIIISGVKLMTLLTIRYNEDEEDAKLITRNTQLMIDQLTKLVTGKNIDNPSNQAVNARLSLEAIEKSLGNKTQIMSNDEFEIHLNILSFTPKEIKYALKFKETIETLSKKMLCLQLEIKDLVKHLAITHPDLILQSISTQCLTKMSYIPTSQEMVENPKLATQIMLSAFTDSDEESDKENEAENENEADVNSSPTFGIKW